MKRKYTHTKPKTFPSLTNPKNNLTAAIKLEENTNHQILFNFLFSFCYLKQIRKLIFLRIKKNTFPDIFSLNFFCKLQKFHRKQLFLLFAAAGAC